MNNRILKEEQYHNKRFTDEKGRVGVAKYYSITSNSKSYFNNIINSLCFQKKVLEYGCGTGSNIGLLLDHGANVTGIDISTIAIEKATERFKNSPVGNLSLYVMNAEELEFEDNTFDLICGLGILHHLDLHNAFKELSRTLKPDGVAIFVEPLGHNPLINFYRKITPNYRTKDEHPFITKDFGTIKLYFDKVEFVYFHLCTMAAIPFRKCIFFRSLVDVLDNLDKSLFNLFPFLAKYAWQIIIILRK